MAAIPYSNVVEGDWHPDWLYGYGPIQKFNYKVSYCGAVGDACCEDGGPACADGGSCVQNKCVACGGKDEVCCDDTKCDNANLLCNSTTTPPKCKHCGSLLETCCPGDKCDSDMLCSQGTCRLCGKAGQICCAGATCTDSNTRCDGGSCKAIAQCNSEVHAGSNSPESFDVEMGKAEGWATVKYNTFTAPDNIIVSYDGTPVVNTECFGTQALSHGCVQRGILVSCCDGIGNCETRFRYGPGSSTKLQVDVNPNCNGPDETEWFFSVTCPQ